MASLLLPYRTSILVDRSIQSLPNLLEKRIHHTKVLLNSYSPNQRQSLYQFLPRLQNYHRFYKMLSKAPKSTYLRHCRNRVKRHELHLALQRLRSTNYEPCDCNHRLNRSLGMFELIILFQRLHIGNRNRRSIITNTRMSYCLDDLVDLRKPIQIITRGVLN